jgi:hypothetical protein
MQFVFNSQKISVSMCLCKCCVMNYDFLLLHLWEIIGIRSANLDVELPRREMEIPKFLFAI